MAWNVKEMMDGVPGQSRGITEPYHCSHVKVETMHVNVKGEGVDQCRRSSWFKLWLECNDFTGFGAVFW